MQLVNKELGVNYSGYFKDFIWNFLPDAILEGIHGEVRADEIPTHNVVVLTLPKLGIFIPGGDASHPAAREFLREQAGMSAFFTASEDWVELLRQIYGDRLREVKRYAFTSEELDLTHLKSLASRIPEGYRLARLDLTLSEQLAEENSPFSADHMLNFDSPGDFLDRGFGWCLLQGDEIVCVASTFLVCSRGIEIQINTREEHRGRGLATAAAANLIVESLENGLDPNWDAANETSGALAKKLGYVTQGEYLMYVYIGEK